MPPNGLEAILLANRDRLLRFLAARGAGDTAEDLLHDLWLKITTRPLGPISNPVAYLHQAANSLLIDRYRTHRRDAQRDHDWQEAAGDGTVPEGASAERIVAARQEVAQVAEALAALGPRCETVFRRVRLDGVAQRRVAQELNISISTVESDLRTAARTLVAFKERVR